METIMDTDEEFELLRLTPPSPQAFIEEDRVGSSKPEERRILLGKRSHVGRRIENNGERNNNGADRRLGKQPSQKDEDEEEVITRRYTDPRNHRNRAKVEPLDNDLPLLSAELDLLDALGLSSDDLSTPGIGGLRSETLHLIGVNSLNTTGVFELLSPIETQSDSRRPAPQWIEWIDDNTCNAVFDGWRQALIALAGICGLFEENGGGDIDVRVSSGSPCLRCTHPGLLARFALTADRKNKNANRTSEYYKQHGNPNYDNLPGVLSRTYRRRINSRRCALEMRQIAERGAATVAVAAAAAAAASASTVSRRRNSNGVEVARRRTPSPPQPAPPEKWLRRHYSPSPSPPRQRSRQQESQSPPSGDLRYSLRRMRSTREDLGSGMFKDDNKSGAELPLEGQDRRVFFLVKASPPSSPPRQKTVDPLANVTDRHRVRRDYLASRGPISSRKSIKTVENHQRPAGTSDTASRLSSVVQMVQRPSSIQQTPLPPPPPPKSVVVPRRRSHHPKSPSVSSSSSRSSSSSSTGSGSSSGSSSSGDSSSGTSDSSSSSSGSSSESEESGDEASAEWTDKTASTSVQGSVRGTK